MEAKKTLKTALRTVSGSCRSVWTLLLNQESHEKDEEITATIQSMAGTATLSARIVARCALSTEQLNVISVLSFHSPKTAKLAICLWAVPGV